MHRGQDMRTPHAHATTANLGTGVLNSGTVYAVNHDLHCLENLLTCVHSQYSGAAREAALEGIPSTAFSATNGSQISFTTLTTNRTSALTHAALTYADLTTIFVRRLLAPPGPILPRNISLNVNYPATTNCSSVAQFRWVLTRINANASAIDVHTCGTNHLPAETTVVHSAGCFASVSVFDARTKADTDSETQRFVLERLGGFLSCFPSS